MELLDSNLINTITYDWTSDTGAYIRRIGHLVYMIVWSGSVAPGWKTLGSVTPLPAHMVYLPCTATGGGYAGFFRLTTSGEVSYYNATTGTCIFVETQCIYFTEY